MENENGRIEKGKGIMFNSLMYILNLVLVSWYFIIDDIPRATFFLVLMVGLMVKERK